MTKRVPACLGGLAIAITTPPAWATDRAVSLPAGPLGRAAELLSQQAATNIVLDGDALWSRPVVAIRGRMTADAAIRALARAAGVRAIRNGRATWRLAAQTVKRSALAGQTVSPTIQRSVSEPPPPDVIVMASKRGTPARYLAGSVEILKAPSIDFEAGTQALVTRSTIISSTYRGAGREKLFIRGLSDSSFSGRLQSLTGLYFGDVRLTYSASDPDLQLYDIESIEVAQGSQGTLYGSGSLAGIIRLQPVMPKRGVASATMGIGVSTISHGGSGSDLDATVNVPIANNLSIRAVGFVRSEPGYIDKPAVGTDVNSVRIDGARAIARWWPGQGWTVDAIAIVQSSHSGDIQYETIGARRLTELGPVAEPFGSDYAAGHLVLNGHVGSAALVSATGLSSQHFQERFAGQTPLGATVNDVIRRNSMLTHETRISRTGESGAGWVVGLSYVETTGRTSSVLVDDLVPLELSVHDELQEGAAFGEASVRLTPFLMASAGARAVLARSRTRFFFPFYGARAGRRSEHWLLPTASIVINPSSTLSAYVRYQQGKRPSVAPLSLNGEADARRDERIETVDVGARWYPAGGWVASASVEGSRWRDLQIDTLEAFVGLDASAIGEWRTLSGHVTIGGPLSRALRIDLAATLNKTRAAPGNAFVQIVRPPDIAGVVARADINWTRGLGPAGSLNVNLWARYEGRSYGTFQLFSPLPQGDYTRLGLQSQVQRGADKWLLSIDNLLNVSDTRYAFGSIFRAGSVRTPVRPRSIWVGYRRSF
ncbi:MAG: TonB-dependent receptor plug domain-containing protein [Sphingomonas phyllosphaerae]